MVAAVEPEGADVAEATEPADEGAGWVAAGGAFKVAEVGEVAAGGRAATRTTLRDCSLPRICVVVAGSVMASPFE